MTFKLITLLGVRLVHIFKLTSACLADYSMYGHLGVRHSGEIWY